MEEELIRNMEHLKPQEQRNEVCFMITIQFCVHLLHIQVVSLLFLIIDLIWLAKSKRHLELEDRLYSYREVSQVGI